MSITTSNQADALPETSTEMESAQMFGKGTLYFQNGDVFIGEWRDGDFQGFGALLTRKKCNQTSH